MAGKNNDEDKKRVYRGAAKEVDDAIDIAKKLKRGSQGKKRDRDYQKNLDILKKTKKKLEEGLKD